MEMILLNNIEKSNKSFEDIKHVDENGVEFWYARELMKVLSYKDWRYFDAVIEKAKSCSNIFCSTNQKKFETIRKK